MLSLAGVTILEWFVLIWVCFSIPLYVIILFLLIKYRKEEPFNGSFFKLCISLGVADLCCIIFVYPLLCFRIWGWIDFRPLFYHSTLSWWFRALPYISAWICGPAQFNGVAILAFNRFRNIVHREAFLMTIGFVYYFSIVITVGVLYSKMYMKIRAHNKDASALPGVDEDPELQKTEMKLALMGFVLFLLSLVYCVLLISYAIMTKISTPSMVHLNNILLYQTAIIFSLINPYLLIICSRPTKEKFFDFFGWKKNDVTVVQPFEVK